MPEHHRLPASPDTVHWGYWDATREPVLEVASGDRVTIESISGEPDDLPPDQTGVSPEHIEIHKKCDVCEILVKCTFHAPGWKCCSSLTF